ncbi:protein of unknown function [Nitrosomonas aestuarii]|uniref:DUF4438 domain-containing protein n=1 Tax=Nitrosomonas aestuarii TaxID=52441 RepID=A0A1I4AN24_9PROT|nr:DUF4438 domain-containing protein [Nitrosomonas aestuarii]SFK57129.1 protein of unknown function [Nitrosomonas aestuarii]
MNKSLSTLRLHTNERCLVMTTVMGEVSHPSDKASPYRIGQDGVPRILPGVGGVIINHRIGDACIGLVGDHVEPGVSIKNYRSTGGKVKDAFNLALNTYACIGNRAVIVSGPCAGHAGIVTGKHGGIDHVLLDFPVRILKRLRIGDRIQIYAYGTGLKINEFPAVEIFNCSPQLLRSWGIWSENGKLNVPVTHRLPARVMGSGIGLGTVQRGDYDIQLFDRQFMRSYQLDRLRFGDMIAIMHADTRFGRSFNRNFITFGIVVHGDSTVSGHGPGVVSLICGSVSLMKPVKDDSANIASILRVRPVKKPLGRPTLIEKERKHYFHRLKYEPVDVNTRLRNVAVKQVFV